MALRQKFILNDGDSNQTPDITNGGTKCVYFHGYNSTAAVTDSDVYKIVETLYNIRASRGEYTYGGNTYSSSICAISNALKTTYISYYEAVVAGSSTLAKSIASSSGLYLYTLADTSTIDFVSMETIINRLRVTLGSGANSRFYSILILAQTPLLQASQSFLLLR